ncbi:MAG: YgfZ/GcvT domain-containing protein [Cyanophyceae cyanobacterium]
MKELQNQQGSAGAEFSEAGTPSSFGNDQEAIAAATSGVALYHSPEGLLQLRGADRQRFLHNQTTNDINRLQPGQGCDTVFVTSTGRTLELATAYVTQDAILLLVSPQRQQPLMEWMDRYIFPFDKVELSNLADAQVIFRVIGPQSRQLGEKIGVEVLTQPGDHVLSQLGEASVRIALGSGLALPGYTLISPAEQAASVWSELISLNAVPLGDRVWEQLRVQQGRPAPGQELTEDYNPLEAGLWSAISFEKGCYIGQETIARLNTYKGVKQRLWGVQLEAPVQPGPILAEGKKIGELTSCIATAGGASGLAYVRSQVGDAGLEVWVQETPGKLVSVPFLSHEYYQPQK